MRKAFDAVTVANLPATSRPNFYFAYINGKNTSNNYAEVRARFPDAIIRAVTTDGSMTLADMIDQENGDYSPASAAACAKFQLSKGKRPSIYCSRAAFQANESECAALGMRLGAGPWGRGDVDWACTTLDGTQAAPGSVGVQWTDHGGAFDEWIISDPLWLAEGDTMACEVIGNTIHVFDRNPDGSLDHWWNDSTNPGWHYEKIPT